MQLSELYDSANEPSESQIKEFVGTPLWDDLADYLLQAYDLTPKLFYSGCAMDKGEWNGWNVKYKKSGKALCTLYPKQEYFMALVVIGVKESVEADLLISLCDEYTQKLYNNTKIHMGGKWLAMEVTSENILQDLKSLIALRVKPKEKV